VDFLFVFIELGSLGLRRANIDWKSAFLNGVVRFGRVFT